MEAQVSVAGLDIAKSVFQVHGADAAGKAVIRRRLKREEVEAFFRNLPPSLVALEACPGSHFWARLFRDIGHDVRLLPAQYVRAYVKTNRSDAADAEAIREAVTRPTMRFVPIKEEMQQEVLVLHRVREMLIRQRTQLINSIRGHLAEFGIVAPNRAHNIGSLTKLIEDEEFDELPAVARHALRYLVEQLREVKTKLFRIDRDLIRVVKGSDACRRLMTIPGVGVVTATALVSSMREPSDFESGRHFAAWLGLVPKQHSTGGKENLGGISKRGDCYLRRLLIHGSRSIMRWRGRSWTWLSKLRDRRPAKVAAVAIANKTARIIWSLLMFGGTYGHPGEGATMNSLT
ncbi:IS110 family transposase [Rhizobium laguerreae]|uniref:IS110 family transposase n=1 Tax=Rhizobium laguerreae TaxID=1076926 RepID=UPI001C90423E|nr:IS110 family transposase [Rhizobium laguerreae]MBY3328957.1 IS110 family transposase [Rhizobium laguerreae]